MHSYYLANKIKPYFWLYIIAPPQPFNFGFMGGKKNMVECFFFF